MKTKMFRIFSFLLIFGIILSSACTFEPKKPIEPVEPVEETEPADWPWHHEGLDLQTERELRRAFLNKLQSTGEYKEHTINDVWVKTYYGTFNDTIVVMMDAKGLDHGEEGPQYVKWVKAKIKYNNNNRIIVWKDSKFYELSSIDFRLYYPNNYIRIVNQQNGLDAETESQFIADYKESHFYNQWGSYENRESLMYVYLGTYNGYLTMSMVQTSGEFLHQVWTEEIGGVIFGYSSTNHSLAWKDGQFFSLT